jgi:hypothetical protein
MKTYSVHFSRKIKTQNKETEKAKKKKMITSGWIVVLCGRPEGCYLPINKSKTFKKNKPKIFILSFIHSIQDKRKRKKTMTPPKPETRRNKILYTYKA